MEIKETKKKIPKAASQRVMEIADGSETGYVRVSVSKEIIEGAVKFTLSPWLVDENGAYVEREGEPFRIRPIEMGFVLGQADTPVSEALNEAVKDAADKLWRAWKQIREMA